MNKVIIEGEPKISGTVTLMQKLTLKWHFRCWKKLLIYFDTLW